MQRSNFSVITESTYIDGITLDGADTWTSITEHIKPTCLTWICDTTTPNPNLSIFSENCSCHRNSTHTMDDYSNWPILLLTPLILFGVAGNILVCMAISMEKRLQSVTNYFLLSLAVTDLLVSIIVMPFSIINEFTGRWLFGPVVCNLYVTADVFMCTSSILHLCTISLERYMAIRSPLTTRNKSKSIVILKVVLVWITAFAISSPISILGSIEENNVLLDGQCNLNNDNFKLYGSICAFFIPLLIMVLSYSLTLHTLMRQSKKCHSRKEKSGQPIIRRSLSRKAKIKKVTRVRFHNKRSNTSTSTTDDVYTPMITRKTNSRLKSSTPSPKNKVTKDSPKLISSKIFNFNQNLSVSSECFHHTMDANSVVEPTEDNQTLHKTRTWPRNHNGISRDEKSHLQGLVRKHQIVIKAANILLMKRTAPTIQKENDVNTEQKASKVIGIVFIIFVVCWAPFFIMNVLSAVCKESCYFQPTLFTVFVWLGYISSTLNPIIYTMFNKTFKMTFKKLILCRYSTLQRTKRVRSWLIGNGGGSLYQKSSSNNSLDPETPC